MTLTELAFAGCTSVRVQVESENLGILGGMSKPPFKMKFVNACRLQLVPVTKGAILDPPLGDHGGGGSLGGHDSSPHAPAAVAAAHVPSKRGMSGPIQGVPVRRFLKRQMTSRTDSSQARMHVAHSSQTGLAQMSSMLCILSCCTT